MNTPRSSSHVGTKLAAEAIRVHPTTLWRWYRQGLVTPAWVTAGGQTRWDIEDLKDQLAQLPPREVRSSSSPRTTPHRFRRLAANAVYIDGVRVRD